VKAKRTIPVEPLLWPAGCVRRGGTASVKEKTVHSQSPAVNGVRKQ
jgi:hypothetical protein